MVKFYTGYRGTCEEAREKVVRLALGESGKANNRETDTETHNRKTAMCTVLEKIVPWQLLHIKYSSKVMPTTGLTMSK